MKSTKGFSLLETIIAAFIFITVVVGMLSVWSTHARGIAKARMILIANELSEQVMEECVAARYERVNEFDGATESYVVNFVIKDQPISSEFRSLITVATDPSVPEIRRVKVRVEWDDNGGTSNIEINTELHESA